MNKHARALVLTFFSLVTCLRVEGWSQTVNSELRVEGIFHITGIPELKRNGKADLVLTNVALQINKKKKVLLTLPYTNMRQAQLLGSHREYGKSTAAAAIATYGLGAFLILKKRNVEVLVIDYDNERGGLMGLVLQLPQSTGAHCLSQLANHGVPVRTDVTVPGHGPSKGDQQW